MASPTIVLIHGAFGHASSWQPVFERLVGEGHTVHAAPWREDLLLQVARTLELAHPWTDCRPPVS
jgi:pimeloyl-ACP methyl ester carboxylesterase